VIELRPLLEEDATRTEKALLLAGRADGPSKEATAAVLAMLEASPPAGPATSVKPARLAEWVKTAIFAVAVCGAAAVVYYLARPQRAVPPAMPVIPKAEPAAAPGEAPAPSIDLVSPRSHEGPATIYDEEPPRLPAREGSAHRRRALPPGRTREASHGAADSPRDNSLGDETRALDRAREALDAHQPSTVLRLLDDYHRRFPQGRLRPEAMVLRLAALVQTGGHKAARSLARQLLADEAYQAYAARIHSLMAEMKP
jgi:hypothetical protein